jgi:hypothetical protein
LKARTIAIWEQESDLISKTIGNNRQRSATIGNNRNLPTNTADGKIRWKKVRKRYYDQQLKQKLRCNLGYGKKTKNPNFFMWLFLDRTENKNKYTGMNLWMLTEETLESDTKMISGVPIFSASAM